MSVIPLPAPRARTYSRETDLLIVIFLAVVVLSILYPSSFYSWDNARGILRNLAFDGMMAVGMMALMIAGTFDLSVGSTMSLAGVLAGSLAVRFGWPAPLAMMAGLGGAGLCGALNGWVVARVRVNAMITTLGTMKAFESAALLIGGPGVSNLPGGFAAVGQTELLGLPLPVWFMLALAATAHYLLRNSRHFRQVYYVGANAKAARLSGIGVERIQILGFTLMGAIAGAAGLLSAGRMGTALSTAGTGAELRAITAVILGGASLTGGKGSIPGALIGVLFIALVNNALLILDIRASWHGMVVGVLLVLAVALDSVQSKARES
jgi:ribose transport system permease protein